MTFSLKKVVPWGRSYEEYLAMFSLTDRELGSQILGCGDGPASFNAIATEKGHSVVSSDPLYSMPEASIRRRIEEVVPEITQQVHHNREEFLWTFFDSVDALVSTRVDAMEKFLLDFPAGRRAGRYIASTLPRLPFPDKQFDLALCSHFLFLYSAQHDMAFHLDSIIEMYRVAAEVRIFPLLELGSVRSRHLDGVIEGLGVAGISASIARVDYEFQSGANEMLVVGA